MARDYKQKTRRRSPARKQGNGISRGTAFWVGACVGAIVTALVFVNGAKVSVDDLARGLGVGDDPSVEKETRFEFYTVLPGKEMVVPDAPPEPARQARSEPEKKEQTPAAGKHRFMLQAGSFKRATDADARKAQLALLGLEAGIQTVNLGEQGTWHRVMLGPYRGKSRSDKVSRELTGHGIKTMTTQLR